MPNIKLFKYKFACTKLGEKFFNNNFRHGLIFGIKINNIWGFGEYAPINKIHKSSLGDIAGELGEISFDNNIKLDFDDLNNLVKNLEISSQAKYVFSLACFHIWLKKNIINNNLEKILLSKLIFSYDTSRTLREIINGLELGYKNFKLKIKNNNIIEEANKIKKINKLCGENINIRFDFNSNFTCKNIIKLVNNISNNKVEYFEEPVKNFNLNKSLAQDFKISIALDESFVLGDSFEKFEDLGSKYWVIKPSRFGNVFELINNIKKISNYKIKPILSNCFESDLSIALFANLVRVGGLSNYAHGLFVPGMFMNNIFSHALVVQRGCLYMNKTNKLLLEFCPKESPWLTRIL